MVFLTTENVGDGGHTQTEQLEGFAKKDLDRKVCKFTICQLDLHINVSLNGKLHAVVTFNYFGVFL